MTDAVPGAPCIFCRIVAGTAESARVHEDDRVIAFMNIAPATEGHVLVIPKRHSRNIYDIDPADLAAVAAASQRIARLQRERLACDGVSIFQSNEAAGWQTVFHYHVHVVPRYRGDPLVLPWHATTSGAAQLEPVAARLR